MKLAIGLLLALLGGGVMVIGLGGALVELMGLYAGALRDPLGQPDGVEKATSDHMKMWAIAGACGIPFFIIGSIMLKVSMFQAIARRSKPRPTGNTRGR